MIIDDEPKMVNILKRTLQKEGYEVQAETDPTKALNVLSSTSVDVILCDLKMPEMDGITVLDKVKALQPEAEFIIMTAYATVETAVDAMKRGAYDYLLKPFPIDELKMLLARIQKKRALEEENVLLKEALREQFKPENIVCESPAMKRILERVSKVAPSKVSVLLQGESGTGKEVIAKAIHNASPRKNKPMVMVNCGAIPETLLESELFGHVKGAFTDAKETRKGLFQAADKGTIFLDEIGEISPSLQVKLLRVLQEGEFQSVGDAATIKVDVRIIAATNRDLEDAIRKASFRQDLYYRLNVVPIFIPPLRERKEDIVPLVEYFYRRIAGSKTKIKIDPEVLDLIKYYDWPGNIRELENAIEHSLVLKSGNTITVDDLPLSLHNFLLTDHRGEGLVHVNDMTLEEMERRCIISAMQKAKFNHTRAANLLGITRRTLGYRLRKYDLEDELKEMKKKVKENNTD